MEAPKKQKTDDVEDIVAAMALDRHDHKEMLTEAELAARAADLREVSPGLQTKGVSEAQRSTPKVPSNSAGGWQPTCLILGGWPTNSKRGDKVREASTWLASQDKSMTSALLEPWCPRPFGCIEKLRVQPGRLAELGWRLHQELKRQRSREAPTWGAVERSPEVGLEKKWSRVSGERASEVYKDWKIFEGTVWTEINTEAARYNSKLRRWEKREGWMTMNEDWEKFVKERTLMQ